MFYKYVVYGLTRYLNVQRLAKGQLGLPITIVQENSMGTIHYLKYYNTITGLASHANRFSLQSLGHAQVE